MQSKREQIMRLAEFDGEALKAHWLNVPSQDDYESAKFENARLLPLITAMAERIETLDAALEKIDNTSDCKFALEIVDEALTTKGPLEELLEEETDGLN